MHQSSLALSYELRVVVRDDSNLLHLLQLRSLSGMLLVQNSSVGCILKNPLLRMQSEPLLID